MRVECSAGADRALKQHSVGVLWSHIYTHSESPLAGMYMRGDVSTHHRHMQPPTDRCEPTVCSADCMPYQSK